jgi:hypothetical protein
MTSKWQGISLEHHLQETGHMWPSITKAGENMTLQEADMEEHIKDYLVLVPGR